MFGQRYHIDRHGQLALKQLRLPVLNEMHTNHNTGPRLLGQIEVTNRKGTLVPPPTCPFLQKGKVAAAPPAPLFGVPDLRLSDSGTTHIFTHIIDLP